METQLRIIVLLAFVGICAAIKCYDCSVAVKVADDKDKTRTTVAGNVNCNDEFKSTNISSSTCNGVCQKKLVYADKDKKKDKDYQIYRTCANDCEGSDRHEIHCCKDKDLCNAAPPSAVNGFIFITVASVVSFLV